jgi:hypothetical protein
MAARRTGLPILEAGGSVDRLIESRQDGSNGSLRMRLIGLLLVLVLTGVLASRLGGEAPPRAGEKPGAAITAPIQHAQEASDAAAQAEQQRLDRAMDAMQGGSGR